MSPTEGSHDPGIPELGVPGARSARTYAFVALGLAVVLGYLVWDILGFSSVPFAALGIVGGARALPHTNAHPRDRRAALTAVVVSIASVLLLVPPTIGAMDAGAGNERPSAACATGAAPDGASQLEVTTPEGPRPAVVFVPEGAGPDQAFPVVLALAGADTDVRDFGEQAGLEDAGFINRFTVVYPSPAASPGWNPTLEPERPDDVAYIGTVLDVLAAGYCVDLDRVYVTGHSLGGAMAERVACDLGDRIAAVAIVSGAYIGDGCTPTRVMPRLALHGTDDDVTPYEGGGDYAVEGAGARTVSWGSGAGCSSTLDQDRTEQGAAVLVLSSCDPPIELWRIEGGGHEWSDQAAQAVWDFLHLHTL